MLGALFCRLKISKYFTLGIILIDFFAYFVTKAKCGKNKKTVTIVNSGIDRVSFFLIRVLFIKTVI